MNYLLAFFSFAFFSLQADSQIVNHPKITRITDTVYTIIEQEGKSPRLSNTSQMILEEGATLNSLLLKPTAGKHTNYYVIIARLKAEAEVLTLTELFDLYHISTADRTLPVSADKSDFVYSPNVLIVKSAVVRVVITKREDSGKPYINIETNHEPYDFEALRKSLDNLSHHQ